MHPYDHALSSARQHGGQAQDYLSFHAWFDASKAALTHFTHRCLRHHREGIAEAVQIFGPAIVNADRVSVPTRELGLQHLAEDCAHIPTAADWLDCLHASDLLPQTVPAAHALAQRSAHRFGGAAGDYLPLHVWFLSTGAWRDYKDLRHLAMRHHSFGIFEAEARFGILLKPPNCPPVPTRLVAERHVQSVLGRIPSAADFLRRIKGEFWMAVPQRPRQVSLH